MKETLRTNLLFASTGLVVGGLLVVAAAIAYRKAASVPSIARDQLENAARSDASSQSRRVQPDTPRARLLQKFAAVSQRPGLEVVNVVRSQLQLEKEADPSVSSNARATFERLRTERLANVPLVEELCGAAGCLFLFTVTTDAQASRASTPIPSGWPSQMLQVLPFVSDGVKYGAVVLVAPEKGGVHKNLGSAESNERNERSNR